MSILNFAAFAGGKNHARNLFTNSYHDVMESQGFEISQRLAFSFNENGNNRRRMALSLTPLYHTPPRSSRYEHSDPHMLDHGIEFLAIIG